MESRDPVPDRDDGVKLPFLKNGIGQIGLIVENLDQAVENYWRMLGIGPWYIYTYARPLVKRMTFRGKPAEYRMRIALAQVGPMCIELIESLDGDSIYDEFVSEHGYGVHHLGILAGDMEAAITQAEAAGFVVIQDGAGFGRAGDGHYAYLNTEDKIGVTLELLSLPERRVEPDSIYPPAGDVQASQLSDG